MKQKLLAEWIVVSVERSAMEMVGMLVAHGASIQLTEDRLRGSIYAGCVVGGEADCVEALSHHGVFFVGADVNLPDVIQLGNKEVAKILVDRGVNVDTAALGTALHSAVEDAHVELVKDLLTFTRFDVDVMNRAGQSALMMVARQSNTELGAYRDHPAEITRLLLDYGADVNVRDARGMTPLHYACRSDLPAVVRILLDNGADFTACSNAGQYPHDEIDADDIEYEAISEIMDLLLKRGTDLHKKNQLGDAMLDRLSMSAAGQAYIETRSQVFEANTLRSRTS